MPLPLVFLSISRVAASDLNKSCERKEVTFLSSHKCQHNCIDYRRPGNSYRRGRAPHLPSSPPTAGGQLPRFLLLLLPMELLISLLLPLLPVESSPGPSTCRWRAPYDPPPSPTADEELS